MPTARVQMAEVGVKVPVELVVKLTVAVGVVGLVEESVTVAVQLTLVPEVTEFGEQATLVAVICGGAAVADRRNVPWLKACVESPP